MPQDDEHHIGWVTITYRSVFLAVLALLFVAGIVLHFMFPKQSENLMDSVKGGLTKVIVKIFPDKKDDNKPTAGEKQAKFTMIDGTVRVKKKNDNSFFVATFQTPLEKGDVVQTGPEGIAKVVFADKTSYTVKPDSLIVIEENSTNEAAQTKVSVQVTTGTVDLSTQKFSEGSQSEVTVAGATAQLASDSAAQVRSDMKKDNYEILVTAGTGTVKRGNETVALNSYEKVGFKAEAKSMIKDTELQPPIPLDPGNMLSVFT